MSASQPRIVFAGTPDFAATHLRRLLSEQCNIVAVYTQPDRRVGRGKKLQPSAVKQLAVAQDIALFQPENFKSDDTVGELAALRPDILIVVAYGLILPQRVLDIATIAPINVHASLLPRWRGAAPIERAIEAGDSRTGVGIMRMEAGLDTGPVLAQRQIDISADCSGDELRAQLADIGAQLLVDTVAILAKPSRLDYQVQSETGICYAHKLKKEEAAIDWQQDARLIHNKVRAFNSSNITTFGIGGSRVKLWRTAFSTEDYSAPPGTIVSTQDKQIVVACGRGSVSLLTLQMPGGKALSSRDILNGHASQFAEGTQLL